MKRTIALLATLMMATTVHAMSDEQMQTCQDMGDVAAEIKNRLDNGTALSELLKQAKTHIVDNEEYQVFAALAADVHNASPFDTANDVRDDILAQCIRSISR